tara:strand:+ start:340 stop:1536 length:1197 start_codon:yes stop_codon:yes gene_type:complete
MKKTLILILSIFFASTFLNPIAAQAVDGTGLSLSFKTLSGWSTPPSAVTSGACATTTDYLNYDWGSGSPLGAAGCGTDNFVGYGTGYILAPYTGTVSFCAQTDDQSYLKINNQVVIDDPTAHGPSTGQNCNGTGSLEMVAGNYYPIEAWVHENGGGAVWRLLWSWPGNTTKEIVPKINLYPSSFNPDTTAPSLSATSFTVNENLSAPYTAATITLSESSTISSVSGADSARFTLLFPDSTTVVINFNAPPDFEIPIASGGGNDYQISFIATDLAGNGTSAQLITITVSDVLDTSAFNGLSLAGAVTSASYRTAILITADISVASKVTFKLNGKVIPGCKRRLATGSESSFTVTCNWRPSMRGSVTLVATANPIASGIPNATASPVKVFVNKRTGLRGG